LARREEIIRQVRKALGRPSDMPCEISENGLPPASPLAGILPVIAPEEMLPKFEAELTKVAGIPHRAANRQELEGILQRILSHANATSVVLSRNPLLAELSLEPKLRAWGQGVSVWPVLGGKESPGDKDTSLRTFAETSFSANVGITGVEFALAETGSLVVTSWTEGSQLASLAPPVHVALYRRNQLVASLDEVLQRLGNEEVGTKRLAPADSPTGSQTSPTLPGRSVVFITGTSRTADIEQVLIRGVHGPGELHAILVEETCFL